MRVHENIIAPQHAPCQMPCGSMLKVLMMTQPFLCQHLFLQAYVYFRMSVMCVADASTRQSEAGCCAILSV